MRRDRNNTGGELGLGVGCQTSYGHAELGLTLGHPYGDADKILCMDLEFRRGVWNRGINLGAVSN